MDGQEEYFDLRGFEHFDKAIPLSDADFDKRIQIAHLGSVNQVDLISETADFESESSRL